MRNTKNSTRRRLLKPKAVRASAFLLAAILLAMAGCKKPDAEGIEIVLPTTESIIANEVEAPVEGGSLIVALPNHVASIDPYLCDTREVQDILSLVYEPLVRYDQTRRLSAVLAERWEPVDEDARTWRLDLRPSAAWHGTDTLFSAEDVLYSYQLLKNDMYENSYYRPLLDRIESITIEDSHTLLVTGIEPGYTVLHSLTFPIVSKTHFQRQTKPVGTGPYEMIAANPTKGMVLNSNPNWWKHTPFISQVRAIPMDDNEIPLGALEMGQLNYVMTNVLTSSRYREPGKIGMTEIMSQQHEMMIVNHRNPILQDVSVRKAIAYAIDVRDIIAKVYLNHGIAVDVPIAPDSWLYNPESKQYDTNIEIAKKLLQESGWQDIDNDGILDRRTDGRVESLKFRLLANETPENQLRKTAATQMKAQLAQVGIDIEIVLQEWNSASANYAQSLREGSFDLALAGFNIDGSGDVRPFIGRYGNRNYGDYADDAMETLLDNVAEAYDEKMLKTAIDELQMAIADKVPLIPLYFRTITVGYSENFQFPENLSSHEGNTFLGIEKWYLDRDGRELYVPLAADFETQWGEFDREDKLPEPADEDEADKENASEEEKTSADTWGVQQRTPAARAAIDAPISTASDQAEDDSSSAEENEFAEEEADSAEAEAAE